MKKFKKNRTSGSTRIHLPEFRSSIETVHPYGLKTEHQVPKVGKWRGIFHRHAVLPSDNDGKIIIEDNFPLQSATEAFMRNLAASAPAKPPFIIQGGRAYAVDKKKPSDNPYAPPSAHEVAGSITNPLLLANLLQIMMILINT